MLAVAVINPLEVSYVDYIDFCSDNKQMIAGVSITERQFVVAPSNQLTETEHYYLMFDTQHNEFAFN